MNMISTGAFLNEMDASNKQSTVAEKFAAVWEKKNAKAARAGGVSLMALSLAACGGSSSTTTSSTTTTTTTTTSTAGETIAMTSRVQSLEGTAGADTFDGTTAGELQDGDVIDGKAGIDTLDVTIGNSTPAPTLTGVEKIIVQSTHASADLDFTNADTSVTDINVTSSGTAIDFVAVQSNFDLDVDNSSGAITVTFSDDHLGSATAAFDIALDNSTSAVSVTSGGDDLITTLNVNASGEDSSMALTMVADDGGDDDLTTLTVTGDAALTITEASTEFVALTTLNFSGNSGGVTIDLDTNPEDYTITGSSGDDVITADQASTDGDGRTINLGAGDDTLNIGALAQVADTYTGGAGDDTLVFTTAALTAAGTVGVSGFEILKVIGDIDQNMAVLSGNSWTAVGIDGDGDFSNVGAAVTTLNLWNGHDADTALARAVDGTADAITVVAKEAITATDLTLNDEETVTIQADLAVALSNGLTSTDMTSLVLTGDSNIDLSTVTAASLASIDATALTADADVTMSSTTSTANMTITGGSISTYTGSLVVTTGTGNDNVTGTKNADTISTGAGHDTITTGNGGGTVTGGIGNDTINVTNTTAIEDVVVFAEYGQGNYDTITGFTVGTATTADELTMLTANMGWNSTSGAGAAVVDSGANIKGGVDAGNDDTTVSTISTNMTANIFDGFMAGTKTYAEVQSAAAAAAGLTGDVDSAAILAVFIDDGEHTGLFRFASDDNGTDDLAAAAEFELVSIFVDVADATDFVSANLNAFA